MKLSIAPEVHKDTGVPRGTYDKVAGPPCQIGLENQSVIVKATPPTHTPSLNGDSLADVAWRK